MYDKYEKIPPRTVERLLRMQPGSLVLTSLQEELERTEQELKHLQRVLTEPLPGQLLVSGSSKTPKYYLKEETEKRYLPRNEIETAATYAQQEYLTELSALLKDRCIALKNSMDTLKELDPLQAFQTMSPKRQQLVIPEYLPEEDFFRLCSSIRYTGKGFREGDKEYYTARGERVRSKSESDIADRCYYRGIFYLYEYPWTIDSAGIWFPDFTVFNARTRKVYLWEHLGREDDPKYAAKNMRKLGLYQENGFWPGENLILSHETADRPLTIRDIDAIIDHYLV